MPGKNVLAKRAALMEEIDEFDSQRRDSFQAWVQTKVSFIRDHMVFDFITVEFNFCYESVRGKDSQCAVFSTKGDSKYRTMFINVYQRAYEMFCDKQLQALSDSLVHELSHAHTNELSDVAQERFVNRQQVNDANERLTELIAEYVRRLIKAKGLSEELYNS